MPEKFASAQNESVYSQVYTAKCIQPSLYSQVYTAKEVTSSIVSGKFNVFVFRAETQISSQESRYFGGKRRKMGSHFILYIKKLVSKYDSL
jgi:hypothetical protein